MLMPRTRPSITLARGSQSNKSMQLIIQVQISWRLLEGITTAQAQVAKDQKTGTMSTRALMEIISKSSRASGQLLLIRPAQTFEKTGKILCKSMTVVIRKRQILP